MSYSNISAVISAADKATVQTAIQTIKTKLPFLVNLNQKERKKLRKMGAKRISYVQNVYSAGVNNPGAIPSGFNMSEYSKDVTLINDLNDIFAALTPVFDGISDTYLAIGNELMKQSDECYGYLKVSAKKSSNQSLNQTLKKISDQLKQSPQNPKTTPPK